MTILAGDILAVRGTSWLSRGILKATGNTVSHVGIITATSPIIEVTEALIRVKTNPIDVSIADDDIEWAAVLQDKTLTDSERITIVEAALQFSSDSYNYGAILLQLLNSNFNTTWFTDHLSFGMNGRPICSYVAAESYSKTGRNFGVEDRTTTPADIYEYSIYNSDKYLEYIVKHSLIFG